MAYKRVTIDGSRASAATATECSNTSTPVSARTLRSPDRKNGVNFSGLRPGSSGSSGSTRSLPVDIAHYFDDNSAEEEGEDQGGAEAPVIPLRRSSRQPHATRSDSEDKRKHQSLLEHMMTSNKDFTAAQAHQPISPNDTRFRGEGR